MKLMEKTYICSNGVREKVQFPVGDCTRPRSRKRKGATPARKQEANFNSAVRKAARTLNCNFRAGDLLLTLEFDEDAMSRLRDLAREGDGRTGRLNSKSHESISGAAAARAREDAASDGSTMGGPTGRGRERQADRAAGALFDEDAAAHPPVAADAALDAEKLRELCKHEAMLFLRRLKRKTEGSLKYFGVSSDMDGRSGATVRGHVHVVLSAPGISWDQIKHEWKLGFVSIRELRRQPDYTPIAVYLLRQVRRVPDAKKYFCSRGLEQPITEERIVEDRGEIRVQPGATVLERSAYDAESKSQYVRYLPRQRARADRGGPSSGAARHLPPRGKAGPSSGAARHLPPEGKAGGTPGRRPLR